MVGYGADVKRNTSLAASARAAVGAARQGLRNSRRGLGVERQDAPETAPETALDVPRTAILVVNGFDRRGRWGEFNEEEARAYPWIDLCLRQIERHSSSASYEILVWDNTWMPDHRELLDAHPRVKRFQPRDVGRELRHGQSLDRLVKKVHPRTEFVITLDTDSFPVRDGWIENLTGRLTDDVWVAGVWRDEMLPKKPAFIHPSCLAVRLTTLKKLDARFAIGDGNDVAFNITRAVTEAGARTSRLFRSNRWNAHFLMGALYGDLIYHQGAGSRAPLFSAESDASHDEGVRLKLRDAAFSDLDKLVDILAGNIAPESLPDLPELARQGPTQE